jgi:hypothetical protein
MKPAGMKDLRIHEKPKKKQKKFTFLGRNPLFRYDVPLRQPCPHWGWGALRCPSVTKRDIFQHVRTGNAS